MRRSGNGKVFKIPQRTNNISPGKNFLKKDGCRRTGTTINTILMEFQPAQRPSFASSSSAVM